jgi:hypothetical protein
MWYTFMMKTLALILGLLMLVGCTADPVSSTKTNNKNITVDFLFEHEGCKVYRFDDGSGQTVYYANCGPQSTSETSWQHSCGKNCTKHETVPTSNGG